MEMKEKTGEAALMPRLLKELIRTPLIKELVRINLAPSPPGSTRELVKTFFWEDFEFSFGLVSSLPSFLNGLAEFLDELGLQLQKIPPHMLKAFILELGKNIERILSEYPPILCSLPAGCAGRRRDTPAIKKLSGRSRQQPPGGANGQNRRCRPGGDGA